MGLPMLTSGEEESMVDLGIRQGLIKQALHTLAPRERRIIVLRFGLEEESGPMTRNQIAEQFGLTEECIRQIEEKALKKLRHPSRSRLLKDFL